jgi:hypothetical protein
LLVRFLGIAVLDISRKTRKKFSAARPEHFAPKDTHGGILFTANCFRARNSNNAADIWSCGCAGAQMHRKAHPTHDPDTQQYYICSVCYPEFCGVEGVEQTSYKRGNLNKLSLSSRVFDAFLPRRHNSS